MADEIPDDGPEFVRRAAIELRSIGRAHIATHLETLQRVAGAIAALSADNTAELARLRTENERLMDAVEAATWARTRLHEFAVAEQAGHVQGGGRELERRVWGAFSDFDRARAALKGESNAPR